MEPRDVIPPVDLAQEEREPYHDRSRSSSRAGST